MFKEGDRVVLSSDAGPISGIEYNGMKCTVLKQVSGDLHVQPDEPRHFDACWTSEAPFFWPAAKATLLHEPVAQEATDEEVRAILLHAVNTLRDRGYEVHAQAVKTTAITYDF